MRSSAGLSVLLLAVLGLATGCDSDEPLESEGRNASLFFSAPGAFVSKYRIHQMFEDSDNPGCVAGNPPGDGAPDYGLFSWCDRQGSGSDLFFSANSVPWPFAAEIKVLRAGETVPETLLVSTANDTKALYDTFRDDGNQGITDRVVLHPRGFCSGDPARTCNPDDPGSTFCASLGEGECRPALGFCSGDSSVPCDPNFTSNTCQALFAGSCQSNPSGFCSLNRCLRCNASDPSSTTCADAGAGACTADTSICTDLNPPFTVTPCCAGLPTSPCLVPRVFSWQSPFIDLTSASREYLQEHAGSQPLLYDASQDLALSMDPEAGNGGRCPGFDPGGAIVAGRPQPLTLELEKGDTLFVEARRLFTTPAGIEFDPTQSEPNLSATLIIDGLIAGVIGNTQQQGSSAEDFIDFHITLP